MNVSFASPYNLLRANAEKTPGAAAVKIGTVKYTYSAFLKKVDEAAGYLAGAAVSSGDTVTLLAENTPEYLMTFFALSRMGAACNLLRPETNQNQLKKNILDTRSKVILIPDMQVEKMQRILDQTCLQTVAVVNPTLSLPFWSKLVHNYTAHPVAVPKDIRFIKWRKLAKFTKAPKDAAVTEDTLSAVTYDITNPDAPAAQPFTCKEMTVGPISGKVCPGPLHTAEGIKEAVSAICGGGCCVLKNK